MRYLELAEALGATDRHLVGAEHVEANRLGQRAALAHDNLRIRVMVECQLRVASMLDNIVECSAPSREREPNVEC